MFISQEFFKFLIVGTIGTAIDFLLFGLFYSIITLPLVVSNLLSYGIGLSCGFFLNRRYVFTSDVSTKRIVLCLTFGYIGLAFNTIIVWYGTQFISAYIAKTIAVIIIINYNFLTNKFIIFKSS